ncbi:hypothetical protein PIB30_077392, partial [Stylosanthes scabra]|nr:hypothetical protein [Stylosanthes scabra]
YKDSGLRVFTTGKWNPNLKLDYLVAIHLIYENFAKCSGLTPTHETLGPVNAQLHRTITHFILPQRGSYHRVTYLDTLVLFALTQHIPISFAHLMIRHMYECVKSDKHAALPYGMFLSKFFIVSGVDLSKESYYEVKSFLKGDGGIKKTKGRSTKEQTSSAASRSSQGPETSTNKKIKKLVKIVKELMDEVSGLVNMMMSFSKNRQNQEASHHCDLTNIKKLMEMTAHDLQELEKDIYNSEVDDEEEADHKEEEEPEDSDARLSHNYCGKLFTFDLYYLRMTVMT